MKRLNEAKKQARYIQKRLMYMRAHKYKSSNTFDRAVLCFQDNVFRLDMMLWDLHPLIDEINEKENKTEKDKKIWDDYQKLVDKWYDFYLTEFDEIE